MQPEHFLQFAMNTAKGASRVIMKFHAEGARAILWNPAVATDLKNEADAASGRYIRRMIGEFNPDHGIISEEMPDKAMASEYQWVVDELDGTIPFSTGISDHFSVCIALYRLVNGAWQPVLGVTHCPLRNRGEGETYYAEAGKGGAFMNHELLQCGNETNINRVRIGLDPGKEDPAVPNRRLRLNEIERKLDGDGGVNCIMRHGCASVSIALVAAGRMQAYAATQLEPWDMAAGAVIAREAGARVTTLDGTKDWELGDDSILIANPVLHTKLLDMLG